MRAGTASAPFGAYHFGRVQLYFILANMIAVPLAALWVMPAGLIGLALMQFGLGWLAFVPMRWGVNAILYVARTTSALPAATLGVPHMPAWGLALTGRGIAWLGLWRSRLRLAGVPVIAFGLLTPLLVRPVGVSRCTAHRRPSRSYRVFAACLGRVEIHPGGLAPVLGD